MNQGKVGNVQYRSVPYCTVPTVPTFISRRQYQQPSAKILLLEGVGVPAVVMLIIRYGTGISKVPTLRVLIS